MKMALVNYGVALAVVVLLGYWIFRLWSNT